ncbi:MAG: PAS domain S-box protein [Candidatus Tectimicrobiota bacterium]
MARGSVARGGLHEVTAQTLLAGLPDAALFLDDGGLIVDLNPRAEWLFGYHRQAVLGQVVTLLLTSLELPGVAVHTSQAETSPRPAAGVTHYGRHHDGRTLPLDITQATYCLASQTYTLLLIRVSAVPPAVLRTPDQLHLQLEQCVQERTAQLEAVNATLRATEARQRALLGALPDLIFRQHRDGTYLDFSDTSGEPILPRDLIIGRNIRELPFPDGFADMALAAIERALRTGEVETIAYALPTPAGQRAYEARIIKCDADEVVVIVRDLTHYTLQAQALEESRHLTQQIANAMPGIVYLYDLKQRQTIYTNQRLQDILGYTIDDLQQLGGEVLRTLMHPEDWERYTAHFRALRQTPDDRVLEFEGRLKHANGTWVWLLSRDLICSRYPDGTPRLTLGVAHDFTARKQAEEALRESEEYNRCLSLELEQRVQERTAQLAATNKELEAFCYSVSHDLRAPLRAIDGFSQALLADHIAHLDEEGQNYLRRVRAAGQRMGALIDDLLNLSRMTRHEIHRSTVHLSAVATGIAAELQHAHPQRLVEWQITPHLFLEADPNLMRIVLENLLGNAWKYTSKHATARIEFGVTHYHDKRVYFVRDDGAGFDMAYADKLFGAFQRLHRLDEFDGTGIGLAIVERIIHRHGGRVWAEGRPEQGATFYFTL